MNPTPLHAWIANKIGCSTASFSRQQLEEYQWQALQANLKYCLEHSPFYQDLYHQISLPLISLAGWASLPFTTAEDLRKDPTRFVCVKQDDVQRIVTLPTSGTTGENKRIFFTASDQELTIDFFHHGMSTLTKPGDRVLILLPGERPGSVGDLLKTGLERLGCLPFIYGPADNEECVFKAIIEQDSNVLVGAPVQLLRLARLDDAEWILPKNQIHKVLTSTDTLSNAIHASLQALWGCEVFDHWGMTETGLGGGVECEAHHGTHLREADLYVEIIDPVTGQVLPDGETGEVVITTLTRTGMPLLRYRTGDLSRLLSDPCPCGSFIKRLERVTSRLNAGVILPSGMLTLNEMDEFLFDIPDVLDYSATITKEDEKYLLQLSISTLSGEVADIEEPATEMLMMVPVIQTEVESDRLGILISPMQKPSEMNLHVMQKRMIKRE